MTARTGVTTAMAGKKQRTKKAKSDRATVHDIYSSQNIHVTGARPKRREPLECFRPVQQSYFRGNDSNRPKQLVAFTYSRATGGPKRATELVDGILQVLQRIACIAHGEFNLQSLDELVA